MQLTLLLARRPSGLKQRRSQTARRQSKLLATIFIVNLLIMHRNLYYIDYLQSNDPITPTEFEEIWNALAKDVIKVSEVLSFYL